MDLVQDVEIERFKSKFLVLFFSFSKNLFIVMMALL